MICLSIKSKVHSKPRDVDPKQLVGMFISLWFLEREWFHHDTHRPLLLISNNLLIAIFQPSVDLCTHVYILYVCVHYKHDTEVNLRFFLERAKFQTLLKFCTKSEMIWYAPSLHRGRFFEYTLAVQGVQIRIWHMGRICLTMANSCWLITAMMQRASYEK